MEWTKDYLRDNREEAFDLFDESANGWIAPAEVLNKLKVINAKYKRTAPVFKEQLIFKQLDSKGTGRIFKVDFVRDLEMISDNVLTHFTNTCNAFRRFNDENETKAVKKMDGAIKPTKHSSDNKEVPAEFTLTQAKKMSLLKERSEPKADQIGVVGSSVIAGNVELPEMQTTRPDGDDNEKPLKLDAKEDEKEDFGLQGVENERQSEAIHSLSKSLNDGKNSRDIDWSPDSVKENIPRAFALLDVNDNGSILLKPLLSKLREVRKAEHTTAGTGEIGKVVNLTLQRGHGLMMCDLDKTGKKSSSDPYVTIQVNGVRKVGRTKVIHSTINPEWNQIFRFEVNPDEEFLRLSITDENKILADAPMGIVELKMGNLEDLSQDFRLPVHPCKHAEKASGTVELSGWIEDFLEYNMKTLSENGDESSSLDAYTFGQRVPLFNPDMLRALSEVCHILDEASRKDISNQVEEACRKYKKQIEWTPDNVPKKCRVGVCITRCGAQSFSFSRHPSS